MMHRRTFLHRLGGGLAAPLLGWPRPAPGRERAADVVIAGGGTGGCAAALAAARNGLRVVLTEETDWIGGQLTQQAVPPDEHPWIEQFGAPRAYRAYRQAVRAYYRQHYPLTGRSYRDEHLNPGGCGEKLTVLGKRRPGGRRPTRLRPYPS